MAVRLPFGMERFQGLAAFELNARRHGLCVAHLFGREGLQVQLQIGPGDPGISGLADLCMIGEDGRESELLPEGQRASQVGGRTNR